MPSIYSFRNRAGNAALLCLCLGLAASSRLNAEDPAKPPAPEEKPPKEEKLPRVVSDAGDLHTTTWTELNGRVMIVVPGLRDWLKHGKNDVRHLRLFLAGRMITKNEPVLIAPEQEYVTFATDPEPDDRKLWMEVLSEARQSEKNLIPVSVGVLDSRQPFETRSFLTFHVYPDYTPGVLVLLVVLLIGLLFLAARTDLLRDSVTARPPEPLRPPYSLGKVQMASWFYVVVAAFMYIWLITGEYNTLTPSILALIGISAATGLAAVFVDMEKTTDVATNRAKLETERNALEARTNELAGAAPGSPQEAELQLKTTRLTEVRLAIAVLPAPQPAPVTQGFLRDLVRDGSGVSFHRFQMTIWTLVLIIIFIKGVYGSFAMPEFDTTLLGLMGLSSGTYLGFKFPEKPK